MGCMQHSLLITVWVLYCTDIEIFFINLEGAVPVVRHVNLCHQLMQEEGLTNHQKHIWGYFSEVEAAGWGILTMNHIDNGIKTAADSRSSLWRTRLLPVMPGCVTLQISNRGNHYSFAPKIHTVMIWLILKLACIITAMKIRSMSIHCLCFLDSYIANVTKTWEILRYDSSPWEGLMISSVDGMLKKKLWWWYDLYATLLKGLLLMSTQLVADVSSRISNEIW